MTLLGLIAGVSICISLVFWVIGAQRSPIHPRFVSRCRIWQTGGFGGVVDAARAICSGPPSYFELVQPICKYFQMVSPSIAGDVQLDRSNAKSKRLQLLGTSFAN